MITFKGDISEKCKEFLKKQDLRGRWIMWLIIILLLSAGIVFFCGNLGLGCFKFSFPSFFDCNWGLFFDA